MTNYGHDLLFGTFVTPVAQPSMQPVELAIASEEAGLDVVTFQDHPYQSTFHDTWTLLSFIAYRTERIRLSGNVLNLPLRDPAILARSVATLDNLSGGRVELGIGAGGFWDAIAGMGGRRLSAGQSVEALEEAVELIRDVWNTPTRKTTSFSGEYYRADRVRRGPAPRHEIGIWIGSYGPRMLRLTGRKGDGWLPSLPYLKGGPSDLVEMNQYIDQGASKAGRNPADIRRMLNIGGQITQSSGGFLNGPPEQWIDDLAGLNRDYGISGFILMADDPGLIDLYAREIAPAVRERIAAERGVSSP